MPQINILTLVAVLRPALGATAPSKSQSAPPAASGFSIFSSKRWLVPRYLSIHIHMFYSPTYSRSRLLLLHTYYHRYCSSIHGIIDESPFGQILELTRLMMSDRYYCLIWVRIVTNCVFLCFPTALLGSEFSCFFVSMLGLSRDSILG